MLCEPCRGGTFWFGNSFSWRIPWTILWYFGIDHFDHFDHFDLSAGLRLDVLSVNLPPARVCRFCGLVVASRVEVLLSAKCRCTLDYFGHLLLWSMFIVLWDGEPSYSMRCKLSAINIRTNMLSTFMMGELRQKAAPPWAWPDSAMSYQIP